MRADNKQIFETLFRAATEGIIIVDRKGLIIKANPAVHGMFGYQDSLEGTSVDNLLPEGIRKSHAQHRKEYQMDPKHRAMGQDLELYGRKKNGSIFPVEVSLSPSEDEGVPVVIAFIIDITERKKREQVELSMGRLFDQSLNEIYIFECEGLKFIRVNQAAIDNLGYSLRRTDKNDPA